MKQILLILAVVALVGCGEKPPIVEKEIRRQSKKPEGRLTEADLEKVTRLYLSRNKLTDVKGLEKITQLKVLDLEYNQLTDVRGLEKLDQLTGLNLNDNQLTELPKGLEKLDQLTRLYLDKNQLTDVKGLENLTQLETLRLGGNQLTDVKGLEKLTQLTELYLYNNSDLTKAQIYQLKKALPKCYIASNPKK